MLYGSGAGTCTDNSTCSAAGSPIRMLYRSGRRQL